MLHAVLPATCTNQVCPKNVIFTGLGYLRVTVFNSVHVTLFLPCQVWVCSLCTLGETFIFCMLHNLHNKFQLGDQK